MGANFSIATAENYASIQANTDVSSQASCNNNQVISTDSVTFVANQILCENVNIGGLTANSLATCDQYQNIAILSKVLADQRAKAESETGLGWFNMALASSENSVEIQNNIAALIATSCTNSQKVNIGKRSYTLGVVQGKTCNLLQDAISQEAVCIQNIIAEVTNDTALSQDAAAKASAGLDLGQVILFLILIFGGLFILMIMGSLVKSILGGGVKATSATDSSGLFGSGGPSLGELSGKRNALQNALRSRTEAVARTAAIPQILRRK